MKNNDDYYKVDASMPFDVEVIERDLMPFLDHWKTVHGHRHPYSRTEGTHAIKAELRIDEAQTEAFKAGVYAGIALLTGITFDTATFPYFPTKNG